MCYLMYCINEKDHLKSEINNIKNYTERKCLGFVGGKPDESLGGGVVIPISGIASEINKN